MKPFLARLFAVLAVLLAPALALAEPPAAELEFRYAAFPDGAVGKLVYLDVLGTPVPPVEIEDGHGGRYRLNLKISYSEAGEEFIIHPYLYRVVEKKKGTTLEELGDTEVRTPPGDRAAVRFGTDGKEPTKAGFDLDFKPSLSTARVPPPPPAPPAEPEPEPDDKAEDAPPVDDDEFIKGGGGEQPGTP